MEVNLRMAVWNLRRKEKNLLEMVEALEVTFFALLQHLSSSLILINLYSDRQEFLH